MRSQPPRLIAPARLATEGSFLKTLGNSLALALNPFLPKAKRREIPRETMTWLPFGPAIAAGMAIAAFLHWQTPEQRCRERADDDRPGTEPADATNAARCSVEFLIVFLPLFVFFMSLVQFAFVQVADLVTKRAVQAARAAIVACSPTTLRITATFPSTR